MPDGQIVYAIGDIHGRDDLLQELVAKITTNIISGTGTGMSEGSLKPVLIFLGDYIDRGSGAKAVIDFLLSNVMAPFETRFLRGNHEASLLDFLRDGVGGPQWAQYGGLDTLRAYGVVPPARMFDPNAWARAREQLAECLPRAHLRFFEMLEPYAIYGGYCFVHAGLRPGVPIADQAEEDLMWIRDEFLNHNRPFEHIVVHGHSASMEPDQGKFRMGIDTGAYITGRLTSARFEADQVSFIQTGPNRAS